jgi:Transposase DDE domain
MDEKIVFIYCFCHDFLKSLGIDDDPQCKMNSAEIMTFAVVAALFFGGNFSKARLLLNTPRYMRKMLSESRLNRRLHAIDVSLWQSVFYAMSLVFSKNNQHLEYLVDSMPIEVCSNIRSYRCKLLTGKKFIGFCKAKKKFYYGFKIHMITTSNGLPVEFIITPASMADITAFRVMEIDLPHGSVIYGDKAYTDYSLEDSLYDMESIRLIPDRKANLSRQHSGCIRYIQSVIRKRIETTFSLIVSLFSRKIHAVTANGFVLKLVIFIVSFALNQFI